MTSSLGRKLREKNSEEINKCCLLYLCGFCLYEKNFLVVFFPKPAWDLQQLRWSLLIATLIFSAGYYSCPPFYDPKRSFGEAPLLSMFVKKFIYLKHDGKVDAARETQVFRSNKKQKKESNFLTLPNPWGTTQKAGVQIYSLSGFEANSKSIGRF